MPDTRHRQRGEPDKRDRPKQGRNFRGAVRLKCEEGNQDQSRDRHYIRVEVRRQNFQTFDRGEHGQCRRNHRVAVKQRATDDAEKDDDGSVFAQSMRCQRHQRQSPTLSVIVGTQQDHDIFCGDDNQQRPDHKRQDSKNDGFARGISRAHGGRDRFAHRIKRAGADIAIDDADGAERQAPKSLLGQLMRLRFQRRYFAGERYRRRDRFHCNFSCGFGPSGPRAPLAG